MQKQSEEDDLKQVLCAQSVERVRRDNVHERFSNTRDFAGIVGGGGFHDEAGTYLLLFWRRFFSRGKDHHLNTASRLFIFLPNTAKSFPRIEYFFISSL